MLKKKDLLSWLFPVWGVGWDWVIRQERCTVQYSLAFFRKAAPECPSDLVSNMAVFQITGEEPILQLNKAQGLLVIVGGDTV